MVTAPPLTLVPPPGVPEESAAMQATSTTQPATTDMEIPRQAWRMLALATIGFAVNFWAWALISPLGPLFRERGNLGTLSESDVALMVAVPGVVGSLGRILVGALTDKLGGRVMFPLVSGVTIVPVLLVNFFFVRPLHRFSVADPARSDSATSSRLRSP